VLALQSLREEMEHLAGIPAMRLGKSDEAVDEDPPRPNLCRLRQELAVGSLKLLLEELSRGAHHLQSPVTLKLAQVPTEERVVANDRVRGDFEEDDQARFVALA